MIHRFFEQLLFMFTMMFAAGATAVGGAVSTPPPGGGNAGAGGSDGSKAIPSGDGGAGNGNDGEPVSDGQNTAEESSTSDDFGDFESDFGADETEAQAQVNHDEFGPDTYKTVKEALKAHPEVFKAVKKAVSMVKRYQEHFESPEAAGELLGDIQQMGGWDTVKQDLGETSTFLNGYNAGDKEVVSKWLEENQEGLVKNMPTILDKWRAVDEQGWAHDAANTFKATLLQPDATTGMSPIAALRQLGQMEGVKDSDAYKTIMQRINGVIARADETPQRKETVRTDDPKLTQREQQVQQKEATLRKQMLGGKASPVLASEATSALKIVAGDRRLSAQAKTDLVADIQREFARLMEKDADGKQKRQRLLQAGQDEQWLKMVKSAASRTMPTAARNVWRKYAGISGLSTQQKQQRATEGQQRRESGSGGTTQGLQTQSPGDGRQVDWDAMRAKFGGRDKADEIFAFGLKGVHGGKRVWIKRGEPNSVYTY